MKEAALIIGTVGGLGLVLLGGILVRTAFESFRQKKPYIENRAPDLSEQNQNRRIR